MRSTKNENSRDPVRSTEELARHLGLSRWTVSRVINGHSGVHPDTVDRVRKAMSELAFSPNPLAQGLRRGRTSMIGVCVPEIEEFYLGQKLEFLRRTLLGHGFHVMVGMTNGDKTEEIATLNRFRKLRAAGVVLIASQLAGGNAAVRQFEEAGIPLVRVDPIAGSVADSLSVDRGAGMKEAVFHLLDLGHRSLATLGISGESRYTRTRLKGMEAAFRERGLKMEAMVRHLSLPAPAQAPASGPDGPVRSFYEIGREAAARLFGGSKGTGRPTALLALNDRVAIGLMDGLRALGLRVPDEVSVVGYDNMEIASFVSPALTTIDPHPDELVRQTTARLLEAIGGREARLPANSGVKARLVVRDSTGPAPGVAR